MWIARPEPLASSLKSDICAWHNQDQHENQTLTDGELTRMAKMSVEKYLAKAGHGKVHLPLQEIATAAGDPPEFEHNRHWVVLQARMPDDS